jgi:peptidyl-prolyl cis-trans isomerase SurA
MKPGFLCCLVALFAPIVASPAGARASDNTIVSVVNGRPVLKSEVDDMLRASAMDLRMRSTNQAEFDAEFVKLRAKVREQLENQELILKEFEPYAPTFGRKVEAHAQEMINREFVMKRYKGDRAKFLHEMKESGVSYKKFFELQKKYVIVEMMRSQFAKTESPYVTNQEKAEWLKKHEQMFREGQKLKLWSITIPAVIPGEKTPEQQMALAKEVRARLVNGTDFASMAKTHSVDSKRDAGGSWGWVDDKDLAEGFWPVVSKFTTGKITDIITIGDSLYIFWVEARSEGKMRPQKEVDEAVERGLMIEKRQKANDEWIAKLRKKATITHPND